MIEFKNVTKSYGDNVGLSEVNIRIDDGEFVSCQEARRSESLSRELS